MGILDTQLSSPLSTGGISPNNLDSISNSNTHNTYSINGIPVLPNMPTPSQLDLNGEQPNTYLSNPPE